MRFRSRRIFSGDGPVPRGVRLSARLGGGKIGLCLIRPAQSEIAVGAVRSFGYRVAICLRAGDAGTTRQHHCDDPRCPMCHAVLQMQDEVGSHFTPARAWRNECVGLSARERATFLSDGPPFFLIQLSNSHTVVIARSEATKQSRLCLLDGLDCFRLRSLSYGGQVASLAVTRTQPHQSRGANFARVMHRRWPSKNQRAQGTPDAGRTREPCVQRRCTLRTQATTGQPKQSGIPCAMG
jgi:hypothetical protein